MKKLLVSFAVIAMTAAAQATLVGSLQIEVNTNGFDRLTGLATRTATGIEESRGTIQGEVGFLAGSSIGTKGYAGATFKSYSVLCQFNNLNRYVGSSDGGGLITWDYDLTGVANEGVFKLKLDYLNRNSAVDSYFYISYSNGSTMTVDTTDLSTAAFGAAAIVSDTGKYTLLATLSSTSDIVEIDITSIVSVAQTNGGGIRIAYVDNGYYSDIQFQNDSGIITTVPERQQVFSSSHRLRQ
ncbi:hypothetical protein [Tichowtungia aerotolerans]|uniref:Uncharacterized protein n=1 Tax=Tichowtungia aerotolerans TaxID=2697043 RepID=A0A6P1MES1_9BACT|nr:hypothetical protein [Tichowtungia aerotolerans]QHI70116.1 hypothetical protein GT409_11905 [Tichowtungia aerotolerans]